MARFTTTEGIAFRSIKAACYQELDVAQLLTVVAQKMQRLIGSDSFCSVNFDCGCGTGVVFVCDKLAENCGLLLLSVVAIVSRSRRFCLSEVFLRRPVPQPASP